MAAVKGGYGQHVHKGQYDADEGGELPEALPVPAGGKHAADGAEGAYALGSLLGEEVFEVADVAAEDVDSVAEACGYALQQAVLLVDRLVVAQGVGLADAHLELTVEEDLQGVGVGWLLNDYADGALAQGIVGGGSLKAAAEDMDLLIVVGPGVDGVAIE